MNQPGDEAKNTEMLSQNSEAILQFKPINITLSFIFTIITLSFNWPIWVLRNIQNFHLLETNTRIKKSYPVGYIIFQLFHLAFAILSAIVTVFNVLCLAMHGCFEKDFILTYPQLLVVQFFVMLFAVFSILILEKMSFILKHILDEYLEETDSQIKISGFWTFCLTVIYIQYKINEILEEQSLSG